MKQCVRIIGGNYRGKKLSFPEIEGLRPTPDRIRETLFNWLMHEIHDARCLDAFAGSGALGFEAFSRGASKVTFLEQSAKAYAYLKQMVNEFNSPKLKLLQADAKVYLQNLNECYDVVFLDPPYALGCLNECLNSLYHNDSLVHNGLVYWESPTEVQVDEAQWQTLKLKKAGQVHFGLLQKK